LRGKWFIFNFKEMIAGMIWGLKELKKTTKSLVGIAVNAFESTVSTIQITENNLGIALGYGLDNRGSRVRFPAGAGNFSLRHRVQNGSGTQPAFYPMGTRGSFLGGKAAGA
jgi:hypothetical protein